MGRTACTEPQCLYKGALYFYLYLQLRAVRSHLYILGKQKRFVSFRVLVVCDKTHTVVRPGNPH